MTRCIEKACKRARLPHLAHCEQCHKNLIARLFGAPDPGPRA